MAGPSFRGGTIRQMKGLEVGEINKTLSLLDQSSLDPPSEDSADDTIDDSDVDKNYSPKQVNY